MRCATRLLAVCAICLSSPALGDGFIQGTIFDDMNGQAAPAAVGANEAGVRVYDLSGTFVEEAFTDSAGRFQTSVLTGGPYLIHTVNVVGLIDEVHDGSMGVQCASFGSPCPDLVTSFGMPLDVTGGNMTGLNLELSPGFRISGTVTDATTANPIPNIDVCIFQSFGSPTGVCGTTDPSGNYITGAGVPPSTNYRAATDPGDMDLGFYVPELFDDIPFADNAFQGTAIDLSTADRSGIDFQLEKGGKLQINLTGATTSAPIVDFDIVILQDNGISFRQFFAPMGNMGTFITPALPAGQWGVAVVPFDNVHVGQFLNGPACAIGLCLSPFGFDVPLVTVTAEATDVYDVVAEQGFRISGTVLDDALSPVSFPDVCVHFRDGVFAGACVGSQTAKGSGAYTTELLPAGDDYRVIAFPPTDNQVANIWPDVRVPPINLSFARQFADEFGMGDPVAVGPAAGGNATGIDFVLEAAGTISGSVLDEFDGSPVNSPDVDVYDTRGRLVNFGFGSSGSVSVGGLPTGDYLLIFSGTDGIGGQYVPELYQDIFCPNLQCAFDGTLLSGDPVSVTEGATTPVTAQLTLAGAVQGTVLDNQAAPVQSAFVSFFDEAGVPFAETLTDDFGSYEAFLPPGNYFVASGAARFGFVDQVYNSGGNVTCPLNDCAGNIMSGTTVNVPRGASTAGIDFTVSPGGTISGTVVEDSSGIPARRVKIRIFDGAGNPAPVVGTDPGGVFRSVPLPDDTYFLFADGEALGFLNEIYDDIPCLPGFCESNVVGQGTGVATTAGNDTPIGEIRLQAGGGLTVSDLEAQDKLGASVAICGGRVAVGVPGDDEAGMNAGAVLIYRRDGSGYVFDHKILPQVGMSGNPVDEEMFGASVSCDGDLIVIGAPGGSVTAKGMGTDQAAYVMQMKPGASSNLGKLIAANLGLGGDSGFGSAVSMNGMTVAVGAPNAMNGDSGMNSGAAMMFDFADPDPEANVVTIGDSQANAGAGFGSSLSVAGGKVAVGAPNQVNTLAGNIATGLAHVFNTSGAPLGGGKFGPAGGNSGDGFGTSVSLSGGMVAAGAPGDDTMDTDAGAAYVFEFTEGGNFTQVGGTITPMDPTASGNFGASVSLSGNSMAVGSTGADNGSGAKTGAAYVFGLAGGLWNQVQKALAASASDGDLFGAAVAFDGENFVVGAPSGSSAVTGAGFAQAFTNADRLFRSGFE